MRTSGHCSDCVIVAMGGLWRGYLAGVMVWGPYSSIYFCSYEFLRSRQRVCTHLRCRGQHTYSAAAIALQSDALGTNGQPHKYPCCRERMEKHAGPASTIPPVAPMALLQGPHGIAADASGCVP